MTLVQVVADEVAIHMACDFMLTDAVSREPRQYDAHKLMYFQRPPLSAFIGFTGVAVLDGKPAADWITEVLGNVGFPAQMEDILDALSQAPSAIDRLKYAADPRLSFVVGGFVGSQSRIALVSNF